MKPTIEEKIAAMRDVLTRAQVPAQDIETLLTNYRRRLEENRALQAAIANHFDTEPT